MADVQEKQIAEYVVNNIDEAIKQDWIKVYYQPVIRSITRELCSAESLARWIDPEIGFLPPNQFVGALEDSKLIHKLDCYIIEKVCMDIHDFMEQGRPVVPVSVNLSRLDFVMLDMVEVVENLVKKYDIPRDMLHVEITESMIVSDEELMTGVIERFRKAGYEIWMDDFGSGYSSLTLLKDYDFDLLKMDMRFLSTFNEKSKTILRSTVTMAKALGIKTLAEGVETEEHFEFLKSIGCGKIQGYYFGKPEPLEYLLRHMEEKGIPFEERQWRNFYDRASFEVRDTDTSLEVIVDDGKEFKTLFMNDAYKEQISFRKDIDLAEVDRIIYHSGSPLLKKYREMADTIEASGNLETFYYSDNGRYLRISGKCVAKHNGRYLIAAAVYNITQNEDSLEVSRLDSKLRDMHHIYEFVDVVNLKNMDLSPLLGRFKYIDTDDYIYDDFKATVDYFADNFIFPSQRQEFDAFLDAGTMKERVAESKNGLLEAAFRIRQKNGAYEWREIVLMAIPDTSGEEYLLALKGLPQGLGMDGADSKKAIVSEMEKYYQGIWESVVWNSRLKLFWKDKERRFVGVSQAFLDFYGITSLEDIIGKTDEDMQWHVDDVYKNLELDIINKGHKVIDAPGQCIVKGVLHNIICNKIPLYMDGEIVGLAGYFIDGEEELARVNGIEGGPSRIDQVTGLMNARSFLDVMIGYAMQRADTGKNYGLIMLNNLKQDRIVQTFGKEIGDKLLKEIGNKIVEVTGQTAAVARTKNAIYAIMTNVETKEELEKLQEDIITNVESIRSIGDIDVTIRMFGANRLRTDEGITDETIYQIVLDIVQGAEK